MIAGDKCDDDDTIATTNTEILLLLLLYFFQGISLWATASKWRKKKLRQYVGVVDIANCSNRNGNNDECSNGDLDDHPPSIDTVSLDFLLVDNSKVVIILLLDTQVLAFGLTLFDSKKNNKNNDDDTSFRFVSPLFVTLLFHDLAPLLHVCSSRSLAW